MYNQVEGAIDPSGARLQVIDTPRQRLFYSILSGSAGRGESPLHPSAIAIEDALETKKNPEAVPGNNISDKNCRALGLSYWRLD